MMKNFMIEITYIVPFEQLTDTVPEHRNFLQTGYDKGWLLCSGPQVPKTGGIVIARAPSMEEIVQFFTNDPYQKKGFATYRFCEFEPVKRQAFLEDWVS